MSKITVLLYEDNKVLAQSLAEIINDDENFEVVGVFYHCTNCIAEVEQLNPDVVIMDINMPQVSGIKGTSLIKAKFPQVQIIIQTVFNDVDTIFQAISAGASGYILKGMDTSELLQAIKQVHTGGVPMSAPIARKMIEQMQSPQNPQQHNLSAKELEVLQHLVNGLPYKLIASEMNITYDTVRAHIKKIYEKLHVASMTEAVATALKNKIV